MPPVVRSTPDAVPLAPVQLQSMDQPQPLGSGGDTTPCEDTREDHELSFNSSH